MTKEEKIIREVERYFWINKEKGGYFIPFNVWESVKNQIYGSFSDKLEQALNLDKGKKPEEEISDEILKQIIAFSKDMSKRTAKQIFEDIEKVFDKRESYNIVWWGQWKELKKKWCDK